jgi:polysaccharide pyruvyl transferase WcaK-like protein
MKACFYPAHIKKSNLGDILINTLLIRELTTHCPVYLYGGTVEEDMKRLLVHNNPFHHNVIIISQGSLLDKLPIIRWLKLLPYLTKGSHVFDPPGHYAEEKAKHKNFLKPLKYILRAKLLKLFGVKALRLGITLGPFTKSDWERQKGVAKSYQTIAVRDSKNFDQLLSMGFQNISFIDDISFLYKKEDFIDPDKLKDKKSNPYIVVSFRGNVEGQETDTVYLNKVKETLKKVVSENPFDGVYVFSYQVKEDFQVIQSIATEFAALGLRYKIIEKQLSFSEAIDLYYGAHLVYTNRLHVALFAMFNDTPAVVVTDFDTHHKLVNVYKDLGLGAILFDSSKVSDRSFHLTEEKLEEMKSSFNDSSLKKRRKIQKTITDLISA